MRADFKKGTKICSKCGIEKSLDQFNKYKRAKDGLFRNCRQCIKEISKVYYRKHPEQNKKANDRVKKRYKEDSEFRKKQLSKYKNNPKIREWHSEYGKEKRKDPLYVRRYRGYRLMQDYHITSDDYDRLLLEQGNMCKICGTDVPGKRIKIFSVDHNHTTGRVRGLLCESCNRGLGSFKDRLSILEKAVRYLKKDIAGNHKIEIFKRRNWLIRKDKGV